MLNQPEEIDHIGSSLVDEDKIFPSNQLKNQEISYIVAKLIILLFDNIMND